jgi:hypothetical protein
MLPEYENLEISFRVLKSKVRINREKYVFFDGRDSIFIFYDDNGGYQQWGSSAR